MLSFGQPKVEPNVEPKRLIETYRNIMNQSEITLALKAVPAGLRTFDFRFAKIER